MLHGRAWLATRMLSRQGCDLPARRRRDEFAKVAVTGYWNRLLGPAWVDSGAGGARMRTNVGVTPTLGFLSLGVLIARQSVFQYDGRIKHERRQAGNGICQ